MALWGGRFTEDSEKIFKDLNDSLSFDYRLLKYDIIGSISWSRALLSVNVLTAEEQAKIEKALNTLRTEMQGKKDTIRFDNAEDVHSWVEQKLIEMVGDLGKKLHTGRSRNDQSAVDLKLWCKTQVGHIKDILHQLQVTLVDKADEFKHIIIPGYTHLQPAQPISFAHWFLAYLEMMKRDYNRLDSAYSRLDTSPLGASALAGTAYPIDRDALARDLGFARASRNSLDSVSDRDHVMELLSIASISMVHLSRMSEDLIIYNSNEFNFVELSDKVTSGSSIMPQKKNPDSCEVIRGKTGVIIGNLMSILTIMKGLPLSYNKDMQEDKQLLFNGVDTWKKCLLLMTVVLKDLKVNEANTRSSLSKGYLNATELADYLVTKNIPFREAHNIVGKIVLYSINANKSLTELTLDEYKTFCDKIDQDVYYDLSIEACLEKRNTKGGIAPEQVQKAIEEAREILATNQPE